jgi:Tfp pilus assembly protein PilN
MMRTLGVYVGPKSISLVETEGHKIINNALIPLTRLSGSGVEEKVPEEIKIAAAIKDELRKKNIEAKEAGLVLLGRDLIIRTFHMPVLPPADLYNAVRFEAKKYIPFKIEDIVYDYQVSRDKTSRKNLILFVGVKKESLEKYISIFNQINLKISSIDYSGFSILRLLQMSKVREKGITAIVGVDLSEEDEINFIVLENGFPLFSRDIILSADTGAAADGGPPVKLDLPASMDKLKIEMRISLDFYLRKFPTKNINNVVFIAPDEYRAELESFVQERGVAVKSIDSHKFLDRPMAFSLGLFKAYASNLKKSFKSDINIDLLPAKIKAKGLEQASGGGTAVFGFKFDFNFVLLALLIVALPFGINYFRMRPVKQELVGVIGMRPAVSAVKTDQSLDELTALESKFKEKIKTVTDILSKRVFITKQLDSIPRVIPEGLWLNSLDFSKSEAGIVLNIKGSCYLADNDKERKAVNKFLNDLKAEPKFSGIFKEIKILTFGQEQSEKITLTNFAIECRS